MDIDKYAKKLERHEVAQIGKSCAEWMKKIGDTFFEKEKRDILSRLEAAPIEELVKVQARYIELMNLHDSLNSVINKGKQAERKLHEER